MHAHTRTQMEAPDRRSRKRSRKLSEAKVAPELPEKKRKRWSTRRGAIEKELGHEGQEKGHTSKPRKLLVSYDHAHLNLKLKSGLVLEVKGGARESVSRENTPSSVASGGREAWMEEPFHEETLTSTSRTGPSTAVKLPPLNYHHGRTWKNTKQILAAKRALPWKPDDPTCKQQCARTPHWLPGVYYSPLDLLLVYILPPPLPFPPPTLAVTADSSIDAPPTLKPAKKYADMSGFMVLRITT